MTGRGKEQPRGGVSGQPSELGPLIDRVLAARGGLSGRRRSMEQLRRAWIEAAGPDVAAHTRIRSFLRGELVVDVDSGALCHRLASFERDRLLVDLQSRSRGPVPTGLRFRLGAFD